MVSDGIRPIPLPIEPSVGVLPQSYVVPVGRIRIEQDWIPMPMSIKVSRFRNVRHGIRPFLIINIPPNHVISSPRYKRTFWNMAIARECSVKAIGYVITVLFAGGKSSRNDSLGVVVKGDGTSGVQIVGERKEEVTAG